MKFNTEKLPESLRGPIKVGNVYPVRGGKHAGQRMWILVAIYREAESEMCVLLGVNGAGEIVSSASYYSYTLAKWPVIGECPDIDALSLTLKLF